MRPRNVFVAVFEWMFAPCFFTFDAMSRRHDRKRMREMVTDQMLLYAAQHGNDAQVAQLLRSGANVNVCGPDNKTPLMLAVRHGYFRCLRHLLRAPDIDVNMQSVTGSTALMIAARLGRRTHIIELLRNPGIDISKRNKKNNTALSLAVEHGKHKCVNALLCHDATWSCMSRKRYVDLLCNAIRDSRLKCFVEILRFRNIDFLPHDWAPVVRAAICTREGLYLSALCDDPRVEMNGQCLLFDAVSGECLDAAVTMLECPRVDVNVHGNWDRQTALMYAASNRHNPGHAVKLILRRPDVDVHASDECGNTALHYAASNKAEQSVAAMIALEEIDVNTRNMRGETALWQAAWRNRLHNMQYLLACPGMDVNATNIDDITVLGAACGYRTLPLPDRETINMVKCVGTLIAAPGFDIHGGGHANRSAIHLISSMFDKHHKLRSHGCSVRMPPGECACKRRCVLRPFLDQVSSLITRCRSAELRFAFCSHKWLRHDIRLELLGRARWGHLGIIGKTRHESAQYPKRADVVKMLVIVSSPGFGSASRRSEKDWVMYIP